MPVHGPTTEAPLHRRRGRPAPRGRRTDPAGSVRSAAADPLLRSTPGGDLNAEVEPGIVQLTPAEAQGILPDALVNWTVEGLADGSPMTRVIQAVQPTAVPAAALRTRQRQMIDFRPCQGDVALLRVETTNAVPLPIATADPRSGSALGKNLQLAPPRTAPAGPADPQATPAAGGGWASIPAWVWALVGAGAVALVGLAALLVHGRSRGSAPYPTAPATGYSPPQGRTPETRCPRCQEPTIATARFCMNCGTPLHG